MAKTQAKSRRGTVKKSKGINRKKQSLNIDLPDKPSELILLALDDLQKAIKEGCGVDMSGWHSVVNLESESLDKYGRVCHTGKTKKCFVCLAGAVMRRVVPDTQIMYVEGFPKSVANKLWALDQFRSGRVCEGLKYMGIVPPEGNDNLQYHPYVDYMDSPVRFISNIKHLAKNLAKAGY